MVNQFGISSWGDGIGLIYRMNREMIEETYNVQELENKKKEIKGILQNSSLSSEEEWDYTDLLERINKRLRLMRELLIELKG